MSLSNFISILMMEKTSLQLFMGDIATDIILRLMYFSGSNPSTLER